MEAQHYWAETHGKLVANSPTLHRYHHYFSLYEAYQNEPKPTFIGISMFWREGGERPAGAAGPTRPQPVVPGPGRTTTTSSTAPFAGRSTTSTATSWAKST